MSTWLDLKNNPRLKQIYLERLRIIQLTREFFWSAGFLETDTPLAVRYASQEPYLDPFPITIRHPQGVEHRFYLHTSPEYALKKLLCAGFNRLFEISKCFRNNEDFGGTHNPEFTMLEWYRAPGGYQDFMDDLEHLFKFIGSKLERSTVKHQEQEVNIMLPWDRTSMKEVWQKYAGLNLDDNLTVADLSATVRAQGLVVEATDLYEDLFYKLFLNRIEPQLGLNRPLFIYDYPASMASLSRLSEKDSRYAERVECYIAGLEICNGFGELTDAKEQHRRLELDRELRERLGRETWPVDPEFMAALDSGMPPAGGVALGLDRVVLLFTPARDINEVIFQSVADQITDL